MMFHTPMEHRMEDSDFHCQRSDHDLNRDEPLTPRCAEGRSKDVATLQNVMER